MNENTPTKPVGQIPGGNRIPSVVELQQIEKMRIMTAVGQAFVDPASLAAPIPPEILEIYPRITPLAWRLVSGNMSPEAQAIEYEHAKQSAIAEGKSLEDVRYPVGKNALTPEQAQRIITDYDIIQQPNDVTGQSATVLRERVPDAEIVAGTKPATIVPLRDTEFRPNELGGNYNQDMRGADQGEVLTVGAALGQIAQANAFINEVVRPMLGPGETVRFASGSLSGHMSQVLQMLNPDIVDTSQPWSNISFNPTNAPILSDPTGQFTQGQLWQMVIDTYVEVRDNPASVQSWFPQHGVQDDQQLRTNTQLLNDAINAPTANPNAAVCPAIEYYDNPRTQLALKVATAQFESYGLKPSIFNNTDPATSATVVDRPGNLSVISVAMTGADIVLVPSIGAGTANVLFVPIEGQNALVTGGSYIDMGNNHSFYNTGRSLQLQEAVQQMRMDAGLPLLTTGEFMAMAERAGNGTSTPIAFSPNSEGKTEANSFLNLLDMMREAATPPGETFTPTSRASSSAYGQADAAGMSAWEAGLKDLKSKVSAISQAGGSPKLIDIASMTGEERIAAAMEDSPTGAAVRFAIAQGSPIALVNESTGAGDLPTAASEQDIRAQNNSYELVIQGREQNLPGERYDYHPGTAQKPLATESTGQPVNGAGYPVDSHGSSPSTPSAPELPLAPADHGTLTPDLTDDQLGQLLGDLGGTTGSPPTWGEGTQYANLGSLGDNGTATDAGWGEGDTDSHDPTDPSSIDAQNGFDVGYVPGEGISEEQAAAQAEGVATAMGVLNNLMSLGKWDDLSDIQRLGVLAGSYNLAASLSNGQLSGLPPSVLGALGLIGAIESGNPLSIASASAQLGSQVLNAYAGNLSAAGWAGLASGEIASDIAVQMIDDAAGMAAVGQGLGEAVPFLNLALALESGNPYSIAGSMFGVVGAMMAIPGLQVIGFIVALASTFQDQSAIEGTAAVTWDDGGQLTTTITHSAEGGGANAKGTLDKLLDSLSTNLATNFKDETGNPAFALNPAKMPQVGYHFDPDGTNYQNTEAGTLKLTWTDENGQSVTRYYDAQGNHDGQSIAQDFARHSQAALVPAWMAEQAKSEYQPHIDAALADEAKLAALQQEADAIAPREAQQGQGEDMVVYIQDSPDPARYQQLQTEIAQLKASATEARQQASDTLNSLPSVSELGQHAVKSADGTSQSISAITLTLPDIQLDANAAPRQILLNTDNDAFLEKTDWVQANQAVLGIDLDGDGRLSAKELLTGDLTWLDANHDGRLDASDPAFKAIRLWSDINGDGQSLKPKLDENGQPVKDDKGNIVYESEAQSLSNAGIAGIDFADGQVSVERSDGSTQQAGAQTLNGDTRGVLYSKATGGAQGIVQTSEQEDGSGDSVLLATNTRAFDGKAEHRHGGDLAAGIVAEQDRTIDVGDARLHSTSFKTVENTTVQTLTFVGKGDARLHDGAEGHVLRGQDSDQTASNATAGQIVSDPVPAGGAGGFHAATAPQRVLAPRETVVVQGPASASSAGAVHAAVPEAPPAAPKVLSGQVAGVQTLGVGTVQQSGAAGQTIAGQSAGVQAAQSATQITSNGQTFAARAPSAQPIVVNLGSARIQSDAPTAGTRRPVVFVPGDAAGIAQAREDMAGGMIRAAEGGLFSGASGAATALAIGVGAAQWGAPAFAAATGQGAADSQTAAWQHGHGAAAQDASNWVSRPLSTSWAWDSAQPGQPGAGATLPVFREVAAADLSSQAAPVRDAVSASAEVTPAALAVHGWTSVPATGAGGGVVGASGKSAAGSAASVAADAAAKPLAPAPQDELQTSAMPPQVTLQSVNAAPVVQDESAAGVEDTWLWIDPSDLLANDSDVEDAHSQLAISAVGPAAHGSVSLEGGRILFKPDLDYHGPASFAYTVTDSRGASSQGTAHLEIGAVNDAPRLVGEELDAREGEGLVFSPAVLLANDKDVEGDAIRISRVGEAANGTVLLDADGQIRFVPEPDFHGLASFTYWVADSHGAESAATVQIRVVSINDAPLALGETIFSDEDAPLLIAPAALLANDRDIDGPHSALQIIAVGDATHGTVALLPDGSISFTPEPDYVGTATFTYTVSDGEGGQTVAIAKVDLANVNDAPRLVGETIGGTEDTPLDIASGALLANDDDVDGPHAALVITSVGNATHGSVVLNADGSIRFTPDANYNVSKGPATFEYTVADAEGAVTTGVATLNIASVNDAPVAHGEIAAPADEDTVLSFTAASLLANDADVDNTPAQMSVSSVGDAQHGMVALGADGSVTFTPELNYSGAASFTYTVSDGAGGLAQATVTMQFNAVNDAPTLVNDVVPATEDNAVLISPASLLANDNDVDTPKAQLALTAVGNAQHGTVLLQADGQIRFTPDANFNGMASFSYTVSDGMGSTSVATAQVRVGAVNDLPAAHDDALPDQVEDTNLLIMASALLANDTDADTQAGTNALPQVLRVGSVSAIAGATHGSVSLDANGNVQFVPDQDYAGPVSFVYTVADGAGGVSTSTVSFAIANINDAPVLVSDLLSAKNQAFITIAPGALLTNDMDPDTPFTGDALTVTAVHGAQHGTAVLQADGSILFTPDPGFLGVAQFSYDVSDGHGGTSTSVAEVNTVNLAPVVTGEALTLQEDNITTIAAGLLLANDSDADNAAADLHIVAVGDATHGSVALNAAGDVVFTPDLNYFGPAQFTYTVADGDGGQSTATVKINVQSVNDAPVVVGETATFEEDQIAVFSAASLLANDTDIETPGSLSIAAVGNASGGSVQLVGGQVQFTPWANHEGAASFTYTVSDGHGGFTQAAVNMQFTPVNDAPVVNSESFDAQQDVPYAISYGALLANDTDAETPGGIFIADIWGAQNATVTMTANGVEFTPTPGFSGLASFNYTVSDAQGLASYGTTTVNVVRTNHNPVAVDDGFSGLEDMPFHISVGQLLVNDADPDTPYAGDQLSVTGVSGATNGTVSLVPGSHVVFTPNAEYSGPAQFSYEVSDGKGGVTMATAYLTVNAVNDAPVIDSVSYDTAPDAFGYYSGVFNQGEDGFAYQERDRPGYQSGTVSAHDVDSPGGFTYSISTGPVHGHASVDASGNWVFESEVVDPYVGADLFTVKVTDSGGASTLVEVAGHHDIMVPIAQDGYNFPGAPPVSWTVPATGDGGGGAGDGGPGVGGDAMRVAPPTTSIEPLEPDATSVVADTDAEEPEASQRAAAAVAPGSESPEPVLQEPVPQQAAAALPEQASAQNDAPAVVASTPASDADVAQQAQLFNSWANTAAVAQPPLAFVPSSGAVEVVVEGPSNLLDAANDQAAQPAALVAVG